ncbi:MAG: FtsX-like permease family protein [Acidimicrobiales bacterium]
MRLVGTHAGAVVPVRFASPTGHARTVPFRVVGTVALPTGVGDGEVGLGTGAALTIDGYEQAACPPGTANVKCVASILANAAVLASATRGGSGHVAIEHIISTGQSYVGTPFTPTTLVKFGEPVDFPLILGVVLAIFGAATLTHLLIVSVGRRRREMGLLKALGFVSRQVGAKVYWQATTVTLVGLVVGVPVGIALGRVIWRAFALNVGVVPVPVSISGKSWAWARPSFSEPSCCPSARRSRRHGRDPPSCYGWSDAAGTGSTATAQNTTMQVSRSCRSGTLA